VSFARTNQSVESEIGIEGTGRSRIGERHKRDDSESDKRVRMCRLCCGADSGVRSKRIETGLSGERSGKKIDEEVAKGGRVTRVQWGLFREKKKTLPKTKKKKNCRGISMDERNLGGRKNLRGGDAGERTKST